MLIIVQYWTINMRTQSSQCQNLLFAKFLFECLQLIAILVLGLDKLSSDEELPVRVVKVLAVLSIAVADLSSD